MDELVELNFRERIPVPCCENCSLYTGAPGGHCMNNGRSRKPGEWCPAWEKSICSYGACDLEEESDG